MPSQVRELEMARHGEDGPTHQPVEQLIALRAIPGLITLRPAGATKPRKRGAS
jgi:transketolase